MNVKTGDRVTLKGRYQWVSNIDRPLCSPTWNEREIPLDVGDTVPPVRSCNSAAYYTWIGA